MSQSKKLRPDSLTIHAGLDPLKVRGAVSVPIFQSSTFAFESADQGAGRFAGTESGYIYTRLGNPTIEALQEAVCALEGGHAALGTASGMAAISTVMLALLRSGDHVIGTDAVYGPTRLLLEKQLVKFGIESSWIPTEDDKAYIHSLMYPVLEVGKIAQWIAPPAKGIKDKPFEFEYVRRA